MKRADCILYRVLKSYRILMSFDIRSLLKIKFIERVVYFNSEVEYLSILWLDWPSVRLKNLKFSICLKSIYGLLVPHIECDQYK